MENIEDCVIPAVLDDIKQSSLDILAIVDETDDLEQKREMCFLFIDESTSLYHASLYDSTWQYTSKPIPKWVNRLKEPPCDGVRRLKIHNHHLDMMFDKYPDLELYKIAYYMTHDRKLPIGEKFFLGQEIEEFLLSRLSVELFDCVQQKFHFPSDDMDKDHGNAERVGVDYFIYKDPEMLGQTLIFEDRLGLDPPDIKIETAFGGIPLLTVVAPETYFPQNGSSIDINCNSSVEIVRLRKRAKELGYASIFDGLSWWDSLQYCRRSPDFAQFVELLKPVIPSVSEIVEDINRISGQKCIDPVILVVDPTLERTLNLKKYYKNIMYCNCDCDMTTDHPRFVKDGIDILIVDFSWSNWYDPCSIVTKLCDHITKDTVFLFYGPNDILELFGYHCRSLTKRNVVFNHCFDSLNLRMSHLRMVPSPTYGRNSYCWLSKGTIPVGFSSHDFQQSMVVVQGELCSDVYFYGHTDVMILNFIKMYQKDMQITQIGGFEGTKWFKIRFYIPDWMYYQVLCRFDVDLLLADEETLLLEKYGISFCQPNYQIRLGCDDNDVQDIIHYRHNEAPDPHDHSWIYHPPISYSG